MHKTPSSECNWRGITAWMPTHMPNLWDHSPWECPSYSRTMHADYPWDVTLTGHLFSSGSLIVSHPTVSPTLHAWTSDGLVPSLSNNWSVACKTPFSTHPYCSGLPRSEASTPYNLMPPPPRLPSLACFVRC